MYLCRDAKPRSSVEYEIPNKPIIYHSVVTVAKGQLISECIFDKFLPKNLKIGQIIR